MSNTASEVITATGGNIAISSTSSAFDIANPEPIEETTDEVSQIATSNENSAVLAVENSGILDESDKNFTLADDLNGNGPVRGGAGNDTIFGRTGSDRISGGAGNDFLAADSTLLDIDNLASFTFDGFNGNDTLNGGTGNDIIFGGAGSDKIRGGAGDDTLRGGLGNDTINGGAGTDVVEYFGSQADYSFSGSAGNLTISGNGEGTDNIINAELIVFLSTNESVNISDII